MTTSAEIKPGTATVWWLGQGSFVFEGPRSGPLVIDPYLSDSCGNSGGPKRLNPIPVAPGDLTVAAIFLTHDHQDHTDPETLPELCAANPDAPIYGPLESVEHLERLEIHGPRVNRLERGQRVTLPGVTVHAVHAEHTDDSVGLIFDFEDGPTLYHTADTEYYEAIGEEAATLGIDLMTICINGRWGNMGIPEAVKVTQTVGPAEVLPMHWGLFSENTADPQQFVSELQAAQSSAKPILLEPNGHGRYTVSRRS
jgi:L-ascorbate metabolism protein UlaG (beta-lactamase superfamily)